MSILLTCSQISNESIYVKIIAWTIPFILGLFASFIIDIIRNRIKNRKNRQFIKYYLRNSILKSVVVLKSDYETIKKKIETYASDGKSTISAHEDFNKTVLEGISSVEYYSAFKKQFILLNEITSMIGFLSENLPCKINNEFYHFLDAHLKEKDKIGDKEHVKGCEACKQEKASILAILKSRMKETDLLKQKIEELIK